MKKEHVVIALILALIITAIIKRKSIVENLVALKGIVTRSVFINYYKDLVKKVVQGTGLFPSVMMAQAILESSDANGNPGNSSLARLHNNYFGIKADKSWPGSKVIFKTREVVNGVDKYVDAFFRKYPSVQSGFTDRVNFLIKNSRYKNAGVFTAPTPEAQAQALKLAGYATDPNYATILINLINKHNLKTLDI